MSFHDEKSQKLIESDIKSISIEILLRVWIAQNLEDAMEAEANNIEVRFYRKCINGFDVIFNG